MQPLDNKQLLPNQGNVWREPTTLEYLDLVIADALMHGAKWSSARQRYPKSHIVSPPHIGGVIKTLRFIVGESVPFNTQDYYWAAGVEKSQADGVVTWYIHTVNHNEMVNYINKWGIPKE